MAIRDEASLGEALKREQDTIEIEGDLAKKVFRIKATGTVAWGVALAAVVVAVGFAVSTGGAGIPAGGFVGIGAVSILGLPAAVAAVGIAVAGGIGALSTLRGYRVVSHAGDKLVLSRK